MNAQSILPSSDKTPGIYRCIECGHHMTKSQIWFQLNHQDLFKKKYKGIAVCPFCIQENHDKYMYKKAKVPVTRISAKGRDTVVKYVYKVTGVLINDGKGIVEPFTEETRAISEGKARANIYYRFLGKGYVRDIKIICLGEAGQIQGQVSLFN